MKRITFVFVFFFLIFFSLFGTISKPSIAQEPSAPPSHAPGEGPARLFDALYNILLRAKSGDSSGPFPTSSVPTSSPIPFETPDPNMPIVPITPFPETGGNTAISQGVLQLAQALQRNCPQHISTSNEDCVNKVVPAGSDVSWFLKPSTGSEFYLQCVRFVYGAAAYIQRPLGPAKQSTGDAISNTYDRPGYRYIPHNGINSIATGDVIIWRSDTYGHIGYILSASDKDERGRQDILIAEANQDEAGTVSTRRRSVVAGSYQSGSNIKGWVRAL